MSAKKYILELEESDIDWIVLLHKWLKETGHQRNIRLAIKEIFLKPLLAQMKTTNGN